MLSFGNAIKTVIALGVFALIAFGGGPLADAPPSAVIAQDSGGDQTPAPGADPGANADPSDAAPTGPKPPEAVAENIDPANLGAPKAAQTFAGLEASLDAIADSVALGDAAVLDAVSGAPLASGNAVAVSVFAASDISDAKTFLESNGVSIDYSGDSWLEAYVPAALLRPLAQRNDVIRVAPLIPASPDQTAACATTQLGAVSDDAYATGEWVAGCDSIARRGRRAQFYTFSTSARALLDISLTSAQDSYLILRDGSATSGNAIAENNNRDVGFQDARISIELPAGSYAIEATTAGSNVHGEFTLAVKYAAATTCAIDSLGSPDETTGAYTVSGTYDATADATACESTDRQDAPARFYEFNIAADGNYIIDLAHPDSPQNRRPLPRHPRRRQDIGTGLRLPRRPRRPRHPVRRRQLRRKQPRRPNTRPPLRRQIRHRSHHQPRRRRDRTRRRDRRLQPDRNPPRRRPPNRPRNHRRVRNPRRNPRRHRRLRRRRYRVRLIHRNRRRSRLPTLQVLHPYLPRLRRSHHRHGLARRRRRPLPRHRQRNPLLHAQPHQRRQRRRDGRQLRRRKRRPHRPSRNRQLRVDNRSHLPEHPDAGADVARRGRRPDRRLLPHLPLRPDDHPRRLGLDGGNPTHPRRPNLLIRRPPRLPAARRILHPARRLRHLLHLHLDRRQPRHARPRIR